MATESTPCPRSVSTASCKEAGSRGVSTAPSARSRSVTPSLRRRGTSGSGGARRRLYRSGFRPSRISSTSRWPPVVSRPTVAPLRSRMALVATVVPCTMRSVRPSRVATSSPIAPASRSSPSSTPTDWSAGVEGALAIRVSPSRSTATRSVKVPPMSMPIRYSVPDSFMSPYPSRPPPRSSGTVADYRAGDIRRKRGCWRGRTRSKAAPGSAGPPVRDREGRRRRDTPRRDACPGTRGGASVYE